MARHGLELQKLVGLMGEVACAEADSARFAASKFARIGETELARIDAAVAAVEARQPKFDGWATPGANLHAAALDLARTAARRAERRLVALGGRGKTMRPVLDSLGVETHTITRQDELAFIIDRSIKQAVATQAPVVFILSPLLTGGKVFAK